MMKYIKTFEKLNANDLFNAVNRDDIELVKKIINLGVDINLKDAGGNTSLNNALIYKNKDLIKLLVESGADVNIKDDDGDSPLYLATLTGDMEICKLLIKFGADMNAKNGMNNSRGVFDFLTDNEKEEIINSYPEKYEEYLIKKDAEKYNL